MQRESDLYFHQLPVGEMANLAYLLGSRATRECLVVDPAWEVDALLDRAEADGMRVVGALVTHYHPDHVGGQVFGHRIEGVARLLERQPVPLHVNEREAEGTRRVTGAAESDVVRHAGGDALCLGSVRVRLLHTPGHTPGSQCFLLDGRLVSGDTLFIGSCGRCDLPGSSPEQLYESLTQKLMKLDEATAVFPGHHYAPPETQTTIAAEKRHNPFFNFPTKSAFLAAMGYPA